MGGDDGGGGIILARRVSHPFFAASDRLFLVALAFGVLLGDIPRNTSAAFAAAFFRLARSCSALDIATRLPLRLSVA